VTLAKPVAHTVPRQGQQAEKKGAIHRRVSAAERLNRELDQARKRQCAEVDEL